ncbi:S8 family serine peptidase [Bradyrhizobium sp. Pa8]|uniref:S8 family serine peptidase n=1 Tax=Bradyrhizobium sp. Pa8 TaxID=3386552 RepID=UPI00403FA652
MRRTRTATGIVAIAATFAGLEPAAAGGLLGDVVRQLANQPRAMIELSAKQLPNQEAVKELFKLEATEGPAQDYLAQIKTRCGWLDPLILEEFKKLNGVDDLTADLSGRKTLKYPACVKYTPSTAIVQSIGKAPVAGDLDKQVETALNASKELPTLQESAPTTAAATTAIIEKQLTAAKEAQIKGITTESRRQAFETATTDLAERLVKDPALAAQTMRDGEHGSVTAIPARNLERAGNADTIARAFPPDNAVSYYETNIVVPAALPASTADCQKGWQNGRASNYLNWPFDTSRLLDTFLLNASERTRRGRSLRTVPVMIADTGFDINVFLKPDQAQNRISEPQQFFSAEDFFGIDDERGQDPGSPLADQNGDGMFGNEYGFSLASSTGEIGALKSYTYRDHGMSVASLAIGGIQLYRYRMLRPLPIRLHFANLMEAGPPPGMANKDLSVLISYAQRNEIDIINMSFESKETIKNLRIELEKNPKMLAVVASGNFGLELDTDPRYPANLGGELASKGASIITVGALREDGSVADFSNWSPNYVDILAPGCFIPVPKRDGSDQLVVEKEHGTSFAAPIVTFVATLLKAEGLPTPDVKRRIVVTAEHDKSREGKARFGAKLDPEAALAIYNDIIDELTTSGGKATVSRSKGRLDLNAKIPFSGACGSPRELKRIYRIDRVGRTPDGKGTTFQVFFSNPRDGVKTFEMPRNCDVADDVSPIFQFYDSALLSSRKIAFSNIQTVMLRER